MTRAERTQLLKDALASRIVILDGAMGTMIQQHRLQERTTAARASATTRPISRARTTCWC